MSTFPRGSRSCIHGLVPVAGRQLLWNQMLNQVVTAYGVLSYYEPFHDAVYKVTKPFPS